jgi:hypothetical protein
MRIITVSATDSSSLGFSDAPIPLAPHETDDRRLPRLEIRVVPADRGSALSSLSLVNVVDITQRLLDFAAHDVVHGVSAGLCDRRFVEGRVRRLARMRVESGDDETFAMTAVLAAAPLHVGGRTVGAGDVLSRFVALLEPPCRAGAVVCLGVLQALEDLDAVLKREAARIEYRPSHYGEPAGTRRRLVVDRAFVRAVAAARRDRQGRRRLAGRLDGVLTSVDLARETLRLRVGGRLVGGTFTPFMRGRVIGLLGQAVELRGMVEYEGTWPTHIAAQEIEAAPAESASEDPR